MHSKPSRSFLREIRRFSWLIFALLLLLTLWIAGSAFTFTSSLSKSTVSAKEINSEIYHALAPAMQPLAAHATRTPKPTSTPIPIPPPSNPTLSNLMILIAGLILLVILFGVWINRTQVPR